MQNYRSNAMPYNNYRHSQPSCMSKPHTDDSCMNHPRTDDTCMNAPRTDDCCMAKRDIYGDKSLAMAYVPWQTWRDLYDTEKGFHCGTIFQELNLPFLGKGGMKR